MKRLLLVLCALVLAAGCSRPAAPPEAAPSAPASPVETVPPFGPVVAATTGDVAGTGSTLVVEVLGRKPEAPGQMTGLLMLQVKDPAGKVLASVPLEGTVAHAVQLPYLEPGAPPFVVVHGRLEAVSDHTAFARVFRLVGGKLQPVADLRGWYGATGMAADQSAILVYSLWYAYNEYIPTDLTTKPAPKLRRTQTYAWRDGKLVLTADQFSRLAYALYNPREAEKPLPPVAVALRQEGEKLLGAGKAAEAVDKLKAAVAAAPDYPDALNDLAYAYAQLKRWDESRQAAAAAASLNPWHAYAQFNLGVALLEMGLPKEAISPLSVATGLQLDRWEPHYHLGLAYERTGDQARAAREYDRAERLR